MIFQTPGSNIIKAVSGLADASTALAGPPGVVFIGLRELANAHFRRANAQPTITALANMLNGSIKASWRAKHHVPGQVVGDAWYEAAIGMMDETLNDAGH